MPPVLVPLLPGAALALGLAAVVAAACAIMRVDRRWRAARMRCCRCQHRWLGTAKLCVRCGARGMVRDPLDPEVFYGPDGPPLPSHDWQGRLDTGPIPRVPVSTV